MEQQLQILILLPAMIFGSPHTVTYVALCEWITDSQTQRYLKVRPSGRHRRQPWDILGESGKLEPLALLARTLLLRCFFDSILTPRTLAAWVSHGTQYTRFVLLHLGSST